MSIVVVSYNTRELTLEALRSAVAATSVPYELIVVDNASTDGSADAIAEAVPDATLIRSPDNLGFARANNVAAERAAGEYLLLLNPDTVVLDHAIDRLVGFAADHPSARIWGGRTLFGDRSLNPASCWREMSVWSCVCRLCGLDTRFAGSEFFNREGYGGWDRSGERDVDIVSGCFFLIERSLWDQLGGFDPRYEMYGEEADLCLRARRFGARPRVTAAATIVHYGGASESVRSGKHIRLLRAKITLARVHMSPARRWAASWLLRTWPLSRWLAAEVLSRLRPGVHSEHVRSDWREVWRSRRTWWDGYPERGR